MMSWREEMKRRRQNNYNTYKKSKYTCNTLAIIRWVVILLTVKTVNTNAQTPVDKLLLLQSNEPAFAPSLSVVAGIKHARQLPALQEKIAAIQYSNYNSNIIVYYAQDGDEWLSEKSLFTYYDYKAINGKGRKLHFGLNIHYHNYHFHERNTKGIFNYSFNTQYQWNNNNWNAQFFLNMDNNAIPVGTSLRFGKHLTDNFSIEIQPRYYLDVSFFTTVIRMKYSIFQYFTFLFEQHITHWVSDFSLVFHYKRIQIICQSSWHQYMGDVWYAYLTFKPIK